MRTCTFAGCQREGTDIIYYWGARHALCPEHSDYIGGSDDTVEYLLATGGMLTKED